MAADVAEAYELAIQSSQRMRELTVIALGSFDIKHELSRIRTTSLIIVGEQDITCPPSYAWMLSDGIPNSRLIHVPNCAHLVPVEQPKAFCEHTLAFLAEIDENIKSKVYN